MSEPTCETIRPVLAEYSTQALGEPDIESVRRHLKGCDACSAELAALEATGALIDTAAPLQPSRDLWPGIASELEPRPRESRLKWLFTRRFAASLAAATLVTAVLVLAVVVTVAPHGSEPVLLSHATDIDAPLFAEWHATASLDSAADPVALAVFVSARRRAADDPEGL